MGFRSSGVELSVVVLIELVPVGTSLVVVDSSRVIGSVKNKIIVGVNFPQFYYMFNQLYNVLPKKRNKKIVFLTFLYNSDDHAVFVHLRAVNASGIVFQVHHTAQGNHSVRAIQIFQFQYVSLVADFFQASYPQWVWAMFIYH